MSDTSASSQRPVGLPRIDDRDWRQFTLGQRIQQLEVEGYLVLPDLLNADHIARLKEQTARFETTHVDYSVHQRGRQSIQFTGGAITELIAYPPMIEFLKILCGAQIVLMSYDYSRSEPGHPGISLHCDGQPWGSRIFGAEYTCPKLLRVLYYLDDLIPEVSPFRVVPRSHLSFHNEANPYLRYEKHPEEVMVTCKAGSAVVFNNYVFHGNYPNVGAYAREALQLSYRPTWAGPAGDVSPWDAAEVAKLSPAVRELMSDRSARIWIYESGNKPPDMPQQAPGINPSRWERE
ncbi:MAG: phytanoyl-CoA dioxygenase family protein [Candidatus Poribacteria bacterium]|nr:phytanoyl-CoA dioxygenase family protein [Candidatus Poribacteria bacterium]